MLKSNKTNLLKGEGYFALPLKFFALFLVFLSLSACSSKTYTPKLKNEFVVNADYCFGDFEYSCKIVKTEAFVSITPTNTNASELTIKCDGSNIYFIQGNINKELGLNEVDVTNPARVLYEVFSSLETAQSKLSKGSFILTGKVSAGEYTLCISKANELKSLDLPSAEISIIFNN